MIPIKNAAFPLLILTLLTACAAPPTATPAMGPTDTPAPTATPLIPPREEADQLSRILERGYLRVAVYVWPSGAFAPPVFRGLTNAATGGPLSGMEVEIAHQIAETLDLQLELVPVDWQTITSGAWQDDWDIALAALIPFDQPYPNAIQRLHYSQPYAYLPLGVAVSPRAPRLSETVVESTFAHQAIAVLEYSPYSHILTEPSAMTVNQQPLTIGLPISVTVQPIPTLLQATQALSQTSEPVDAIYGPTPFLIQAQILGWPVSIDPTYPAQAVPLAVAMVEQQPNDHQRLQVVINRVLDQLSKSGYLFELYLRWYDADLTQP